MRLTRQFVMASITGAMSRGLIFNYACCQALVNNNLLTQRSSNVGRLQVEKCVSLFAQA